MQLGGDVSVEFSPTGLVCDIWVPLAPEHDVVSSVPESHSK
jgi:hypothetical protein